MLTILRVDPCIEENGETHMTSKYEIMNRESTEGRLVVRRGQEFFLRLYLNRDYDSTIDGISIVFTLDGIKKPNYAQGSFVVTPLLNFGEISEGAWQASVDAMEAGSIKIKVKSLVHFFLNRLMPEKIPEISLFSEMIRKNTEKYFCLFRKEIAGILFTFSPSIPEKRREKRGEIFSPGFLPDTLKVLMCKNGQYFYFFSCRLFLQQTP